MSESSGLDITQQELFEQVAAGNEQRVRVIVESYRGTGVFPPRLGLLTIKNVDEQTAEDVAESLSTNSPVHKRIHEYLSSQRLHMEYFE